MMQTYHNIIVYIPLYQLCLKKSLLLSMMHDRFSVSPGESFFSIPSLLRVFIVNGC